MMGEKLGIGIDGTTGRGGGMNFRVCAAASTVDLWACGMVSQIGGGFSHESDHDLALMVSDFLENGSGGADSWYSSDSDSGCSDLAHLADKISFYKHAMDQFESDMQSVVYSLGLSISETDLNLVKSGPCNASCIRFSLVKLLRLSGYDAGVCVSKWHGTGKVPGGDHEYIDVANYKSVASSERLIIDIDFRSHFEIARAVESYNRLLNSLPSVFIGTTTRLKQFLQVMAEAARFSLKQNSMPLPPWRSLAYLQAKWYSPHQRLLSPIEENINSPGFSEHGQCSGHLKRLQSSLHSEIEAERLLKPVNIDSKWRLKLERRRHSIPC